MVIWTLFINLNSLSAASSYQEWFRVKAWASKRDQVFIFYNAQTPRLIIKAGIYSEEAFIQGNTLLMYIDHVISSICIVLSDG